MKQAMLLAGVVLGALWLSGCQFTDALSDIACEVDSDCEGLNQICGAEGYCINAGIAVEPCGGGCGGAEVCDEETDTCVCPGVGGEASRACGGGQICCGGGGCVDVTSDLDHCGACGNACGVGERCEEGACTCGDLRVEGLGTACAAPSACCRLSNGTERCADPRFDAACCGSSVEVATDCNGQFCASGACACGAGTATCGGEEECTTNILTDPANCGACGVPCGDDIDCIGGQCSCGGMICGDNETCCATGCADLNASRVQCGECGKACGVGEQCVGGECMCGTGSACQPGFRCCGGDTCALPDSPLCSCGNTGMPCGAETPDCCGDACVDLISDVMNCGECGKACGAGQTCTDGVCTCEDEGLTLCGDTCVDVLSSAQHCGACGKACDTGQTCCSGQCRNLSSDLQNCGACGSFCGGESCTGGQCSCGGTPVDLSSDPQNCGACSTSCDRLHVTGESCIGGTCDYSGATCEPGFADCNNMGLDGCEANITNNAQHCGACNSPCAAPNVCVGGSCVERDVIVQVVVGTNHSCARHNSGVVKCWGLSSQIGIATNSDAEAPVAIAGNHLAVDIDAGYMHTCIATVAGQIYCWGANNHGKIGMGSGSASTTPVEVELPEGARAIDVALGLDHSCAIVDRSMTGGAAGEVWCWGWQENGRLGNGQASGSTHMPVRAGDLTGVIEIAAAEKHTCALRNDGKIFCFGNGHDGRVGDNVNGNHDVLSPTEIVLPSTNPPSFAKLALVHKASLALDTQGGLWTWGSNEHALALGGGNTAALRTAPPLRHIAGGERNACAITTSGGALCWGDGSKGQIGDDGTSSRNAPTAVHNLSSHVIDIDTQHGHSCAVLAADAPTNPGGVMCWGENASRRLGRGVGMHNDSRVPVPVANLP